MAYCSLRGIGVSLAPVVSIDVYVERLAVSDAVKLMVRKLFSMHKAKSKLSPTAEDRPINMILEAFADALQGAAVQKEYIDLVIYTGVTKGIMEPCQAHLIASAVGCTSANAIDLSEACVGWLRGVEVAEMFIQSNKARNVAVVSSIWTDTTGSFEAECKSTKDLEFTFPMLSSGSCATVTILSASADPADDMNLKIIRANDSTDTSCCGSFTQLYDIYTNDPTPRWKPGMFFSWGGKMAPVALRLINDVARRALDGEDGMDIGKIVVTHSVSKAYYDFILSPYPELQRKALNVYEWAGNLVDNTVPVGILQALEEGKISGTDRISMLVNSAGSLACFASLTLSLNSSA